MSAHGGGSGLRGTAGRWAACLGQRPPPPCAPPASVQQPSDARAPATCPPPAAGPPGHCPAHRRPEFAPHLCPGRWAGRQGQTPGILAGSRVAAVRWPPSGVDRPPLHSARGRQPVAPSSRQAGRQWGRHSSSRRPGSSGQWPLRTGTGRARSPSQILGTATAGRVSHCAGTPRPSGTRPACLSARPPQRSSGTITEVNLDLAVTPHLRGGNPRGGAFS